MNIYDVLYLCLYAFLSSFLITWMIMKYGYSILLVDIPNSRSSHQVPTIRGGGVAFVITFISSIVYLDGVGIGKNGLFLSLIGSGVLVACIGLIDDYRNIKPILRLTIHFLAAIWVLYSLEGAPNISLFGNKINVGWEGYIIAILFLVWLLNLYNFMDGINGIAGIEAITVCLGMAILYILSPGVNNEFILLICLSVSVAGFLFWNFPKAKIFMGDVGSGFLGLVLGVLAVQSMWLAFELFLGWLILLGVFIVDATVTLIIRLFRKEKIYQAHRSHAYQWAAQRWGHTRVTLGVFAINVFWLFPIALLTLILPDFGMIFVLVAFIPLTILALYLGAGNAE